jgi:hypothetical protein
MDNATQSSTTKRPMTPERVLQITKKTIKEFISNIRTFIDPRDTDIIVDIIKVETFFDVRINSTQLMDHVISHIIPYKDQINSDNMDEKKRYFMDQRYHIFQGIEKTKIDRIADLILSGRVSDANINVIFQYFSKLAKAGDTYVDLMQKKRS